MHAYAGSNATRTGNKPADTKLSMEPMGLEAAVGTAVGYSRDEDLLGNAEAIGMAGCMLPSIA